MKERLLPLVVWLQLMDEEQYRKSLPFEDAHLAQSN
jgi:hypothetical protein